MTKELKWYLVLWNNWKEPKEDQKLSCINFLEDSLSQSHKLLLYFGFGPFAIINAFSEEEACDEAGKTFDSYRGELKKEITHDN